MGRYVDDMTRAKRLLVATLVVASIIFGERMARADTPKMMPTMPVADFEEILKRQPEGPSFDCRSHALNDVEKRICDDATLSRLDLKVNDAYAGDAFESYDALGVVKHETSWLRERDRCVTNACLGRAYRRQLAVLDDEIAANGRRLGREGPRYIPTHISRAATAELKKLAGERCFVLDGRLDPGDGSASLLAHTCDTCSPIDHFILFHPESRSYRILLRAESCYVSGIFTGFQDASSHGLRRISTFTRGGMCGYQYDYYDYDGTAYTRTASIFIQGFAPRCKHAQLTLYTKT